MRASEIQEGDVLEGVYVVEAIGRYVEGSAVFVTALVRFIADGGEGQRTWHLSEETPVRRP